MQEREAIRKELGLTADATSVEVLERIQDFQHDLMMYRTGAVRDKESRRLAEIALAQTLAATRHRDRGECRD